MMRVTNWAAGTFIMALVQQDSLDISSWLKLAEMASFRQQYKEAINALNQVLVISTP